MRQGIMKLEFRECLSHRYMVCRGRVQIVYYILYSTAFSLSSSDSNFNNGIKAVRFFKSFPRHYVIPMHIITLSIKDRGTDVRLKCNTSNLEKKNPNNFWNNVHEQTNSNTLHLPQATGIHMGNFILHVILGVTLRYRWMPSINIHINTTNHR